MKNSREENLKPRRYISYKKATFLQAKSMI